MAISAGVGSDGCSILLVYFIRKVRGGGARLEKPCLGVSCGGCFIPRLTHFSGSSAPFPLLCLSSGKRNTAGCCWSRDNAQGRGCHSFLGERKAGDGFCLSGHEYPALAQPYRNVIGLSLSPWNLFLKCFECILKC